MLAPYFPSSAYPRYGWLGAKQRSRDTLSGLTLMGVRLYDPSLGRFLQTDPVPGGSDNAYDYAHQDPYNTYDLDGNSWWKSTKRFVSHHEMDIALTAVGFMPGLGEATWGATITYRAYHARRVYKELKYTKTAWVHASDRPYMHSAQHIRNVMRGRPMPNSRGSHGAVEWWTPGSFNGKSGHCNLVVSPRSRQIYHFHFLGH